MKLLYTKKSKNLIESEKIITDIFNNFIKNYNLVFLLVKGDLGAGKTFTTKIIGVLLGIKENIKSPTFNILHTYELENLELHHYDLYRIKNIEEFYNLNFIEYWEYSKKHQNKKNISIIEWPEIILENLNIVPIEYKKFFLHIEILDDSKSKDINLRNFIFFEL